MYIKVWEALLYIPRLPSGQFLPLVFALEGYIDRHTLKDNVAYFLELYIVYTVYF